MKNFTKQYILIYLLLVSLSSYSQVGIGTTGPLADGAILHMESPNKGLMIPRVPLDSRLDMVTITPSNVEGLLVYNTATNGVGNISVSPGFYFWDGGEWVRMYDEGYSVHYEQTDPERADNQTTTYTLPNLDQTITIPFTGTYQIIVLAHYGTGLVRDAMVGDAASYCSISLEIDNVKRSEIFISSVSKRFNGANIGTFNALASQGKIVFNVDLVAGQSYNFKVRAREWAQVNSNGNFGLIPGTFGFWGIPTDLFEGNSGGNENGQKSSMTITLLRQY